MKKLLILVLGLFTVIGFSSIFSDSNAVNPPKACYHVTNGIVDPVAFAIIPPHRQSCPPIPTWAHEVSNEDDKNHPEDWDDKTDPVLNHSCDVVILAGPQ